MKNDWFEHRKDMFIKELVSQFFKTKLFFDGLYAQYRDVGSLPFREMDWWVGTELRKGPLWTLKDLCHSLFRDKRSGIGMHELLFDWVLGSIFHECMKLKEDIYHLDLYWRRHEEIGEDKDFPVEVKKILKEYGLFVKKTGKDLMGEMKRIDYLFSKATDQLRTILQNYSRNRLLILLLIDNEELVEQVFGKNALKQIFGSMYEGGLKEAFSFAAESLIEGGWFESAVEICKKALKVNPENTEIIELLAKAQKLLGT